MPRTVNVTINSLQENVSMQTKYGTKNVTKFNYTSLDDGNSKTEILFKDDLVQELKKYPIGSAVTLKQEKNGNYWNTQEIIGSGNAASAAPIVSSEQIKQSNITTNVRTDWAGMVAVGFMNAYGDKYSPTQYMYAIKELHKFVELLQEGKDLQESIANITSLFSNHVSDDILQEIEEPEEEENKDES